MRHFLKLMLFVVWGLPSPSARAQDSGADALEIRESAFYVIETVRIPDDVSLEVGGLALMPSGDIAVATRRGDVWIVENPNAWGSSRPYFRRFARGLHEPLGLAFRDGALYTAQRGELTRLEDTDGDGRADLYDVVYDWPVTGNYHEYSFGPAFRDDGTMIVTLNLGTLGAMESLTKWRGWMLEIGPDGEMNPLATGMRSPAGVYILRDGSVFYTENQGDWIGSGWLTHVERGNFVGHPAGLRWASEPGSPVKVRTEDVPDSGDPMFKVAEQLPGLKPPAVWFPHGILGVSSSGMLEDTTGGAFGPFAGQLFVGDQGHSKLTRVALEKVDGVYQGVAFPFRQGFQSGVFRLIWDEDGAMYVGMTSRGWDATGGDSYGLQRLRWSGMMPFEARTIVAMPDGFEVDYTLPANAASAENPASYEITSFTYKYHSVYGSPVIEQKDHRVRAVKVADDGRRVRLVVDSLRQGYVYEIKMPGIRSNEGGALLHDTGYYTLNRIPEGERLLAGAAEPPSPAAEPLSPAAEPGASPSSSQQAPDSPVATEEARRQDEVREMRVKRVTRLPDEWDQPDLTITIGTEPGLRYDLPSFEVEPGARVEIVFQNDDDMLHNLLVVVPGSADRVAAEAMNLGLEGAEKGYVPDSDDVLFHTRLLQPGTSESIFFKAPSEPGAYTYVCTFPGHATTMRGTMLVEG